MLQESGQRSTRSHFQQPFPRTEGPPKTEMTEAGALAHKWLKRHACSQPAGWASDGPGGQVCAGTAAPSPTSPHSPTPGHITCCCCCTWARSAVPTSTAGVSPLDRPSRRLPHSSKWLPPLDPFWMAEPLLFVSVPDSCIMTQKPDLQEGAREKEKSSC